MDYKTEQDALWNALDDAFPVNEIDNTNLMDEVADLERYRISNALTVYDGNQTKAAKSLKLGRTCLIAKMKKYKLI